MDFLKQLRDHDLFALARNPAAACQKEAKQLLEQRGSAFSRHPDIHPPEPDRRPKRPRDIPAVFDRTVPRHHTEEVFQVLTKVPATALIDMAAAESVYSHEIRLHAAKLIYKKIPTSREFARKVIVKRENDPSFNRIMKEATDALVPQPIPPVHTEVGVF